LLSPTRYAKSGDVHIAYQVGGEGPIDLVVVPGFASHLEWFQEEPAIAHCFTRLAAFSRLIVFDKRGTGLSDPTAAPASLEERMDDVRAVMDAVGSKRAAIVGISEGGALAALFAAQHPERTSALVMYGSYARGAWAPDYPWGATAEQFAEAEGMLDRWGEGVLLSRFAPSRVNDQRLRAWWAQLQRLSASPGMIKALYKHFPEIDVRSALPSIHVPTLVLNRKDDRVAQAAEARYIASCIPEAKLVELEGDDHFYWLGDSDAFLDEIEAFLTGVRRGPDPGRALLTLLFTDIVGSTAHAAELGDQRWQGLLERHHALVRRQLERFGGREVDTAGDGFFAVFDGPARAVRCGQAICAAVRAVGVEIRAGLHTGECELAGTQVRGIAVHIGARIAAAAGPGEVLVSSTVKDLVAGSGLRFSDRGERSLHGVADPWRLFAVENGA